MQHPKSSQPSTSADHQAGLEAYLLELKLPMFLHHYQTYAQDTARSGLSSERFLLALCEAESAERQARRIEHAIAKAKLPFVKEIATYDFNAVENIPKARILDLAEGAESRRKQARSWVVLASNCGQWLILLVGSETVKSLVFPAQKEESI